MSLSRPLLTAKTTRENDLLDQVATGGRRFDHVLFTRNRRVMVSVSDRGRTLRLHEAFADAPGRLLRQVGVFCAEPGTERGRRARRTIRDYLATRLTVEETRSSRRPRRLSAPRPEDAPLLQRLRDEFDAVNTRHFGGSLPVVPMRVSDRMRGRNGHFRADPPEIAISRLLFTVAAEGEAEHTLRHEMIHLWQWVSGVKPGHGGDFRRWARILQVHPRARRRVQPRDQEVGSTG